MLISRNLAICSGVCFIGVGIWYLIRKRRLAENIRQISEAQHTDGSDAVNGDQSISVCGEDNVEEITDEMKAVSQSDSDSFLSCGSSDESAFNSAYISSISDETSDTSTDSSSRQRTPPEVVVASSTEELHSNIGFMHQLSSPIVTPADIEPSLLNVENGPETGHTQPPSVNNPIVTEYNRVVPNLGHSIAPDSLDRYFNRYHDIVTPNSPSTLILFRNRRAD